MDNIDWWAVLNAPPQQGQSSGGHARPNSAVNSNGYNHQHSHQANLIGALQALQGQRTHEREPVAFGPPRDSWQQQQQQQTREAELLSYLSQANRDHQPQNSTNHQPNHQGQGETAFQGLPEWLFPPAINAEPAPFPTVPAPAPTSAPPHWTTFAESPALTRRENRPPSSRGRSRGSSRASSPILSGRTSPAPLPGSRYTAYSPSQLHEVTQAELRASRSDSVRPQVSRSVSINGGIEPEDAEDKRSRNTQASARFRAKKKQQSQSLQRGIEELEGRHAELERDVHDLKRENGFLKDMVMLKWGNGVANAAGVDSPTLTATPATPATPTTPAKSTPGDTS